MFAFYWKRNEACFEKCRILFVRGRTVFERLFEELFRPCRTLVSLFAPAKHAQGNEVPSCKVLTTGLVSRCTSTAGNFKQHKSSF